MTQRTVRNQYWAQLGFMALGFVFGSFSLRKIPFVSIMFVQWPQKKWHILSFSIIFSIQTWIPDRVIESDHYCIFSFKLMKTSTQYKSSWIDYDQDWCFKMRESATWPLPEVSRKTLDWFRHKMILIVKHFSLLNHKSGFIVTTVLNEIEDWIIPSTSARIFQWWMMKDPGILARKANFRRYFSWCFRVKWLSMDSNSYGWAVSHSARKNAGIRFCGMQDRIPQASSIIQFPADELLLPFSRCSGSPVFEVRITRFWVISPLLSPGFLFFSPVCSAFPDQDFHCDRWVRSKLRLRLCHWCTFASQLIARNNSFSFVVLLLSNPSLK
jgi:hypothetical protein